MCADHGGAVGSAARACHGVTQPSFCARVEILLRVLRWIKPAWMVDVFS